MSKLYLCLAILTIAAVRSNDPQHKQVTFKNVRVIGSDEYFFRQVLSLTSANNLNEHPLCRSLREIIDIRGPHFTVLRKNSVTDLPRLYRFGIILGNLKHIEPGAFKNLSNLFSMDLSYNRLKEVEEGIFNNLPVAYLELEGNAIARIAPRAFDNMTDLKYIDLSKNNLTQFDPSWFQNVPKLHFLSLHRNQIEELPNNAFQNLRNNTGITVVFCQGLLKRIGDNLFGGLKEVGELDFSNNEIEAFGDGVLNGVQTIKELDLSNNTICCFSGNFSRIFVAKKTYVGYNPLTRDEGCIKNISLWTKSSEGQGHELLVDPFGTLLPSLADN